MDDKLKIKVSAFTLDCKDPSESVKFYAALLKWEIPLCDGECAVVGASGVDQGTYPGITFQRNPEYQPPVWLEEPETQQQVAYIDFTMNDLGRSAEYAIHCGATVAEKQFSGSWTVIFDSAGHPFCLCQMRHVFESPYFALLQKAAKRSGMSMTWICPGIYIHPTSYQTESGRNSCSGSFLFSFVKTNNL